MEKDEKRVSAECRKVNSLEKKMKRGGAQSVERRIA